jgi:hypothetical protein
LGLTIISEGSTLMPGPMVVEMVTDL